MSSSDTAEAMEKVASELSSAFDCIANVMTKIRRVRTLQETSCSFKRDLVRWVQLENILAIASCICADISATLSQFQRIISESPKSHPIHITQNPDIFAEVVSLEAQMRRFHCDSKAFISSLVHITPTPKDETEVQHSPNMIPEDKKFALQFSDKKQSTSSHSNPPVEVIPGVWLGTQEDARDWIGLSKLGIHAILNVAREVPFPIPSGSPSPCENRVLQDPLQALSNTANLHGDGGITRAYYPPNESTGRLGMSYLKLPWSDEQNDLAQNGFPEAMPFIEDALRRGGVLVHCGDGNISRAATAIVAFVLWTCAAAKSLPYSPSQIHSMRGMLDVYCLLKSQSSRIQLDTIHAIQLLEYEQNLKDVELIMCYGKHPRRSRSQEHTSTPS